VVAARVGWIKHQQVKEQWPQRAAGREARGEQAPLLRSWHYRLGDVRTMAATRGPTSFAVYQNAADLAVQGRASRSLRLRQGRRHLHGALVELFDILFFFFFFPLFSKGAGI